MHDKKRNDLIFAYRIARERHKNAREAVSAAYQRHQTAVAEAEQAARDVHTASANLAAHVSDEDEKNQDAQAST